MNYILEISKVCFLIMQASDILILFRLVCRAFKRVPVDMSKRMIIMMMKSCGVKMFQS